MDHLLQVLCLKGRATHEALGVAVEADATAAIADLEAAGLVEATKLGYRVTDRGRSRESREKDCREDEAAQSRG